MRLLYDPSDSEGEQTEGLRRVPEVSEFLYELKT